MTLSTGAHPRDDGRAAPAPRPCWANMPSPGVSPHHSPSTHHHGVWLDEMAIVLVTVVWGSTFVVVGSLVHRIAPAQVLVVRFVLAAVLLGVVTRRSWARGGPALWRGGVVLGLWLSAGFGFQTLGLAYTTPARAGFITGFCVVLPPLIAAVIDRQRPPFRVLLAAALAGTGVGVISWPGQGDGVNVGDVLVGISAIAYGAHIYATGRHAPRTRADALTAAQIAVAAVLFTAGAAVAAATVRLAGAEHAPVWATALAGRPWEWSVPVLGAIVYLALFATVLAYFLQTRSQRRISATRAGILFALEPLFAAVISVWLGMDALTWRLLAGGALVMGGILISGEQRR
ncbi:MAG: DMT family transporter [Armatimonadota bacterium]|nr:DMT family transporter [Armatimonadota bacterium]